MKCETCGGTGKLDGLKGGGSGPMTPVKIRCPRCRGTGKRHA